MVSLDNGNFILFGSTLKPNGAFIMGIRYELFHGERENKNLWFYDICMFFLYNPRIGSETFLTLICLSHLSLSPSLSLSTLYNIVFSVTRKLKRREGI